MNALAASAPSGVAEAICPEARTLTGTPPVGKAFDAGRLYELLYQAKNPKVAGLTFAIVRDLPVFFKHADQDDAGNANQAAAFSVCIMVVVALALLLFRLVLRMSGRRNVLLIH